MIRRAAPRAMAGPDSLERQEQARMVSVALTIVGAPRTKKNHGTVAMMGGRKVHLPSLPFRVWEQTARIERPPGVTFPLPARPYNCAALFFRDREAGDAVGYYQGLADLLEGRGILRNDRWLVSWDGSRLCKDAMRPRVEMVLTPEGLARGGG